MIEVESKKSLISLLENNIAQGENDCYHFSGMFFYRDGETMYKVFDEDGNDLGSYNVRYIKDFMLKDYQKRSKMQKKSRREKSSDLIIKDFMAWLHTKPCIVHGCKNTNIEAHHILGRQPRRYDNLCVPLCSEHHRGSRYSWHEGNVKRFRRDYPKETLANIAIKLFSEWLDSEDIERMGYDESKLRFINDRIFDRDSNISNSIKKAIIDWEVKYGYLY